MSDIQDIRASFRRFPSWTQHFWTWLTGKALSGQRPLFTHRWWSYLLVTLAVFFGGIVLSAWAWIARPAGWWLLVPAGWVMTVNGARTLFLVILHQCVHKRFSGFRALDQHIGEAAAILVINQNYIQFKKEHFMVHHNSRTFATMEDSPVARMVSIGIRPGMTRKRLWRRSLLVMVSPLFHIQTFLMRVRSNLIYYNPFQFTFLISFVFALTLNHVLLPDGVWAMVVSFWIPVIFFVQISALLDHLGEHGWLAPDEPQSPTRYAHAHQSWARFNGCAAPGKQPTLTGAIRSWTVWSLRILFYHLPVRLLVVVGDLPNHDFHHRHPGSREWMIAAYARQRDIDNNVCNQPAYIEFWGLGKAIDHVFEGLSKAPPIENPSFNQRLMAKESLTP